MKFKLKSEFAKKNSNLKIVLLKVIIKDNQTTRDETFQLLCQNMDSRREISDKATFLSEKRMNTWVEAFKQNDLDPQEQRPSHIQLVSRVLDTKDLPNISPIINIINAIQVKHLVPVGAHDLDKISGDVTVGKDSKNTVTYSDETEVITQGWVSKQNPKTFITDNSKNILIAIDLLDIEDDEEREIIEDLVATIKHFIPEAHISQTHVNSDTQEVSIDNSIELNTVKTINFQSHKIHRDEKIIEEILDKAVEEILPSKQELKDLLMSGRRIRVYQGFDPTAPSLHIGHTVMMRKLENFRKLGHEVFMLIGDFTGRIGDPTDKTSARVTLTEEVVNQNLKLYKDQASRFIDIENKENPVQVVFNNDWLGKLTFANVVDIASDFTVQQMLKRDMFQKRLEDDKPIYLHEFLYPLMQGFDSVNLKVDVELGGNDQLFNMLAGRHLVSQRLRKNKFVVSGKLLTTSNGKKMSKSEGGAISLIDEAKDIYGKVMSFSDNQIIPALELLTNSTLEEVKDAELMLQAQKINPMELKKKLAFTITEEIKGKTEAEKAAKYFEEVFQKGTFNTEIKEVKTDKKEVGILDLLVEVTAIAKSKGDARRLVEQGAVTINEEKIKDVKRIIKIEGKTFLRAGKSIVVITN